MACNMAVHEMFVFLDRFQVQYDESTRDRIDDKDDEWDISSDTDLYFENSTKSKIKLDLEISFKTQVETFRQTAREKLCYNLVCDWRL